MFFIAIDLKPSGITSMKPVPKDLGKSEPKTTLVREGTFAANVNCFVHTFV